MKGWFWLILSILRIIQCTVYCHPTVKWLEDMRGPRIGTWSSWFMSIGSTSMFIYLRLEYLSLRESSSFSSSRLRWEDLAMIWCLAWRILTVNAMTKWGATMGHQVVWPGDTSGRFSSRCGEFLKSGRKPQISKTRAFQYWKPWWLGDPSFTSFQDIKVYFKAGEKWPHKYPKKSGAGSGSTSREADPIKSGSKRGSPF